MSDDADVHGEVQMRRRPFASRLRSGLIGGFGESAGFAIVAYVLVLAALRLSFSGYLEVDEAEFVGRVDLRFVYDNSHPPLFNWLTRLVLEFSDWNWPVAVTIVKYGALAGFHWTVWDLSKRLAGPRAGAMALAASAFLPQIVWMSATTLAHSTLVMACASASVWAAWRALRAPEGRAAWTSFFWLGLAIAGGALAKFNFGLFVVPFLIALLADPALRAKLLRWPALAALLVAVGLIVPTIIATLSNWQESAGRIEKLYRDSGAFAVVDLPGVGIDGFLGMLVALLAWAAPAVVIWAAARWYDRARAVEIPPVDDMAARFIRALGRSMAGSLALFAIVLLAADMHSVHERYLTPLLAVLPVWLAARWPLRRSARYVAGLAAVAYVAVLAGFWGQVSYSPHRFAIPYEEVAAIIARETPAPVPIIATKHDDEANLLLALGWPGARAAKALQVGDEGVEEAVILWRGRGTAPGGLVPQGYGPMAGVVTVAVRYQNGHDKALVYSFQRFERLDRERPLLTPPTAGGAAGQ